jgi:hypothetical protein
MCIAPAVATGRRLNPQCDFEVESAELGVYRRCAKAPEGAPTMPRLEKPEANDIRETAADVVTLWDGTRGPAPPEPLIEATLAERRALCIADLLTINAMIQAQVHGCNDAGIDQLLGMIDKPDLRRRVFKLNDRERSRLTRFLRKDEGVEINPILLTQDGWERLVDALVHRRLLLEWLHKYCNLVQVRGG